VFTNLVKTKADISNTHGKRDYRYSRKKVIANYSKWNIYAAHFAPPGTPLFGLTWCTLPNSHTQCVFYSSPCQKISLTFDPPFPFLSKKILYFLCVLLLLWEEVVKRENSWNIKWLLGKKSVILNRNPYYSMMSLMLCFIYWH